MTTSRFLSAFVLLCAGGCVPITSTSLRSQADPVAVKKGFKHVMVVGDFADIGLQQDAERLCVNELRGHGHQATTSNFLFFPGRQYASAEIQTILNDAGIDAILILSPNETGSSSTWIPPTTSTSGNATIQGNTVRGSSTTTTSGGYSVEKPWARFHADLLDRAAGHSVWVATFNAGGNAFADLGNLVRSMGSKTGAALVKEGLLR